MRDNAFVSPQRQSKVGIFILAVINFGQVLKGLWPILLIALVRQKNNTHWYLLALIGVLTIFFTVKAILEYRNFSYFIDTKNEKFIIKKGIINKSEIGIETNKIQEVNINQPFIHKLFNVFELEIDSPGSDKKEVKVNAISYQNALDIKNYLLENRTEKEVQDLGFDSEKMEVQETLKISLGSLIKYALTANYTRSFIAIIGFSFYAIGEIHNFLKDLSLEDYVRQQEDLEKNLNEMFLMSSSILYVFMLILIVFVVGIIVNLFINVFKFFGLKVKKKHHQLSLEYGLFNTKNAIIGKRKVQLISETQNYFQKKLDVSLLKFSQISEGDVLKDSKIMIPGCNNSEKSNLIHFIWSRMSGFTQHLSPNFRRLILQNVFFIFIPILISIFAKELIGKYWLWIFVYALLVEIAVVFSFRNNRLFYDDNFLQEKSGIWDIEKKTISIEKIQSIKVSQYVWQKRNNLGSVQFFTAGGNISFRTTNYKKLKKIVNFALYKVEASKKNWM